CALPIYREPRVPGPLPHGRDARRRAGRRRPRRSRLQRRRRRRPPCSMTTDEVNRWIEYHGKISRAMTAERTALESALIPVTAYILIACIECYRRYPEMMQEITAAASPEALGTAGRSP